MVSCIHWLPLPWFDHFDLLIPSIIFLDYLYTLGELELAGCNGECFLWLHTPSLPGWNIVVHPSSDILFTLRIDHLSPGNMWASLAAFDNCLNGSLILCDVLSFELSGRNTSILDTPSFGKSSLLHTKLDVAPELIVNLWSLLLASHLIHVFDFCFVIAVFESNVFIFSSSSSFLSLSSLSGFQ